MVGLSKLKRIKTYKLIKLGLTFFTTIIVFLSINIWFSQGEKVTAKPIKATNVSRVWQQASFPVENFQSYTSGFGYRINPVTRDRQFHQGLDIAAPMGSYVRNWWGGQIVELSDHTACGTMINIKSGNWNHVYCHLMGTVENTNKGRVLLDRNGGILLVEGQFVPAGARIARVGMTGRTTGPHLHWGLMYNGNYIDPANILREMFAQQS